MQYITSKELAGWLRDPQMRQGVQYQIIDVRDGDYAGGNITGAVNVPSCTISTETIGELSKRFSKVSTLIFHCALSQQRGPKAAREFIKAYQCMNADTSSEERPKVVVLKGGFTEWQALYNQEKSLVENFDSKLWREY